MTAVITGAIEPNLARAPVVECLKASLSADREVATNLCRAAVHQSDG